MKVTPLTMLMLEIIALVDSGKYSDISIEDIHHAIEEKRVLRFIQEKAGLDIDLSIQLETDTYGDFEDYFESQLQEIYSGYAGQECRKWGVEHSGLCLVLAWTNEIIQCGINLEWSR